jgi:hypothetical protein
MAIGAAITACTSARSVEPVPTATVEAVPTAAIVNPTPVVPTPKVATPAATPPIATPAPTLPGSQIRSPDAATEITLIAVQFESALNRRDAEAALAMFEDQAEVKIPPDLYVGEAQIRGWLEYLAANHFAAEPGFRHATADRITWSLAIRSDYLNRLGLPSLDGAATLVAHDGRIASYTFILSRDSAARHRAAQLAASQVLQDPVIVGLSTANIYGFNDVFRDSEGRLISYRDVLSSEPGSGPYFDLGGEPIIVRSGF